MIIEAATAIDAVAAVNAGIRIVNFPSARNRLLDRTMTEVTSAFCELLHTADKKFLKDGGSPIQRLARIAPVEATSACPARQRDQASGLVRNG
jgi:hypothetical protein